MNATYQFRFAALIVFCGLASSMLAGCSAEFPVVEEQGVVEGEGAVNGAPSGTHHTLNIIGVDKDKSANMDQAGGDVIFVPMSGHTQIMLREGEFQVIDKNGTDGTASYQLPNPDPENDGYTEYSVYARALGTPGGSSQTTTCAIDSDGETVCSCESMVLVREPKSGVSKFENVSQQLLYIYADLDGDGTNERYPLFDSRLQDYFWSYDNNRLRVAQLRFYPIATHVSDP